MNRIIYAVLGVALVLAIGCGGGGPGLGIKEGDKLVVAERIERARFNAAYGESVNAPSYNEGGIVEVPEGTIMEVFVTPRKEARSFEVRPVKAMIEVVAEDGTREKKEVTDSDDLLMAFIPERYRTYNFLYYTFSFDGDLLGTTLKKVE